LSNCETGCFSRRAQLHGVRSSPVDIPNNPPLPCLIFLKVPPICDSDVMEMIDVSPHQSVSVQMKFPVLLLKAVSRFLPLF
jgi:hypothetical protein